MTKKKTTLSDRELRRTLASLREDVAAPAEFRAKLMQRLQREGIVPGVAPARAAKPGFLAQLAAFLTPARLGLAASAALALVLVLRLSTAPGLRGREEAASKVIGTLGQAPVAPKAEAGQALVASKRVKKDREVAQAPKTESLPEAFIGDEQSQQMPAAPSVGDQAAAAPSTDVQGSTAPLDPKPTYVVVQPTPTPMTQALEGYSQLRGNVVRASQGEAAVLVYRVITPGHVHVELFDRLGHSVAVLRDADQSPGVYDLRWAGGADRGGLAASGIYVMQVQAPGYQVQHKLLLVK